MIKRKIHRPIEDLNMHETTIVCDDYNCPTVVALRVPGGLIYYRRHSNSYGNLSVPGTYVPFKEFKKND